MANFNFAKTEEIKKLKKTVIPWKIVIADDEKDVHTLTKAVLKDLKYNDRPIEFISTYNKEETIEYLKENKDVALILLDVVMEEDDTGLQIAKKIRNELKNNMIQIVLRTGQPGSAPETDVVINYGINDYKEKTELTSKKLITTVITALRTFKTMKSLEASKKGLKQIIEASENFFDDSSSVLFNQGILNQIISILKLNHDAVLVEHFDSLTVEKINDSYSIINGAGIFEGINRFDMLDLKVKALIIQAINSQKSLFKDNICVGYLELEPNRSNIIYISSYANLKEIDKNLIEVFFRHTTVSVNNLKLNEELFTTQKKIIEVLGQVVEKRYVDDPNHIKRVAEMSYILARKIGLEEEEAKTLKIVSPMHDLGKIGISDAILLKPGKLTQEEFETMKEHTTIGYSMLKDTKKATLNMAANVAYEHHERWDGSGYPRGLKGEEISMVGRITAIIDVFDALANKRCYKEAWENENIKEYISSHRGTQFDPKLVDIFLENFDEFMEIQDLY